MKEPVETLGLLFFYSVFWLLTSVFYNIVTNKIFKSRNEKKNI